MKKGLGVLCTIVIGCTFITACPCPPGTHCPGKDEQGCVPCPTGTYQDKETVGIHCIDCRISCGQREIKVQNCTMTSNLMCECTKGFYKPPGPNGLCLPHNSCPPGKGVKIAGTAHNDTVCEVCGRDKFSAHDSAFQICNPCATCPEGEELDQPCNKYTDTVCRKKGKPLDTGAIIGIIIGCIVAVCVVILILIFLYRKGKLPCLPCHDDGADSKEDVKFSPVNGLESDRVSTGNASPSRAENGSLPQGMSNSSGTDSAGILRVNLPPEANSRSRSPISSSSSNPRTPQENGFNRQDSGGSGYTLTRAFTDLSKDLCSVPWEMFFRRLIGDGSDALLGKVKRNYRDDVSEQIYQMLQEWKRIKPEEANLDAIIEELEDMEEKLLATQYRERLIRIV